jgi:hypothetical protein
MRKLRGYAKASFPQPDVLTKTVPTPVEGWDAISPLAAMDPRRAPILTNWVPRPGWVEMRGGSQTWSQLDETGPVETLMTYKTLGGQRLFAASATSIYECSAYGDKTQRVTGATNGRWQWINFTPNLGTTVLMAVNGEDPLISFNGTAWSEPAITGVTGGTDNIVNIWATKRRIWLVGGQYDSTPAPGTYTGTSIAYFMPTDAITGPVEGTLDLGGLWTKGGYLVAITDLTIDGGNGPNDYTAFISSEGQVTLYGGEDPASATDWQLVGTFNLSSPLGYRCATPLGADCLIITRAGLLPLSQVLPFDPAADRSAAITSRIQTTMSTSARSYGLNFGWQTILFPDQDLLILNVPVSANVEQEQYIMNTLTGAWCKFTGWNANSFVMYQNNLYFGGNNGEVILAYVGSTDNGEVYTAEMQVAFNYFEDPGRLKRMTMIQPLMTVTAVSTLTIGVDSDFSVNGTQSSVASLPDFAIWDLSVWDDAVWSMAFGNINGWLSAQGLGHALAVHMYATFNGGEVDVETAATASETAGRFVDSPEWDEFLQVVLPNVRLNAINVILEFGGFI